MGKQIVVSCWQWLRGLWLNIHSYSFLSPNIQVRQRVNHELTVRPAMTADEWHEAFWQSRRILKDVSMFVYIYLQKYSGLRVDRIVPSDHLESDLHLTLVCWFDWQLQLCEDFWQGFGVDISMSCLDVPPFSTVEDLVVFLNQQVR